MLVLVGGLYIHILRNRHAVVWWCLSAFFYNLFPTQFTSLLGISLNKMSEKKYSKKSIKIRSSINNRHTKKKIQKRKKTSTFDYSEWVNTIKIIMSFHFSGSNCECYQFDRINIECFPLFSKGFEKTKGKKIDLVKHRTNS